MKFVFPETKSCFFCIPLRYGLLIWGLLKLLPAVVFSIHCTRVVISFMHDLPTEYLFARILMAITYFVEIIFTVILIYATYKKNLKLLKLFFYYSLIITFMFLYCFIIASESEMENIFASGIRLDGYIATPLTAIANHTVTFFLQAYLIVLVNSMIEVIKREGENSVENGEKHSSAPTQCIDNEKY